LDSLFSIPLEQILVGLLIALGGITAVMGFIMWRQPLLVRMGLRNIVRRRSQTILIVIGLMLSTLIMSAAFATGDTVGYSITNAIYDSFEDVDFVIGFDEDLVVDRNDRFLTDETLDAIIEEFGNDPAIDAISGLLIYTLPVVNPERRLAEPKTSVVGLHTATIDSFRGLRTLDGKTISASTLVGSGTYITQDLANAIDARPGDDVDVFFAGKSNRFKIIDIIRDTSISKASTNAEGFWDSGGMVIELETLRIITKSENKLTAIGISIAGGKRNTIDKSSAIKNRLDSFLLDLREQFTTTDPRGQAKILLSKAEMVAIGEVAGSIFVTFFIVFGLFAIASGILLIFLIFVMLAAERRSEMGMARAVGMQRLHLTEMFLAEGMAYNIGSAAVGALLGLGIAWLLVQALDILFSSFGLDISFHFNWQGFVIAYSLGIVLTFVTVTFSAFRVANINIIRSIRDLPEPQPLQGSDRSLLGLVKAVLGALWFIVWIVLFIALGVLSFSLFIALISAFNTLFFGLASLACALGVAFFYYGARNAGQRRMFETARGRWFISVVWLIAFNLLALITWGLLRSRSWASRHRNAGGWAVVMAIFGLLLVWMSGWGLETSFFSWWQSKAFAYTSGATLTVLAAGMIAVYFGISSRAAFSTAGIALIWYWLNPLPFSLFMEVSIDELDPIDGITHALGLPRPAKMDGNIEMFFVSGIAMTASAVIFVIFTAELILAPVRWLGSLFGGVAPAIKTAVAYPLAAKFRTGMTLAMFGLVVFSVIVMATLNSNFTQAFLSDDASGGFDVAVSVNANNRIPDLRQSLRDRGYDHSDSIVGVGRMTTTWVQARGSNVSQFEGYPLVGVDNEFVDLQRMPLAHRAFGFASDQAVWAAIRSNSNVAIVDASRIRRDEDPFGENISDFWLGVSPKELRSGPWQPIPLTLRDPGTGEMIELQIIGVLEPQVTSVIPSFYGIFTQADTVETKFGGGELESYFVVTSESSDRTSTEVARDIESTLFETGLQAGSIDTLIEDAAGQSRAFQYLFEGFMGLGLIVGVSALGVIAFRTVVERRQQIGMLRAIGYNRRLIALSYFFESSFIALTGITIGLTLGIALSYNLLQSPEIADGANIDFHIPWIRIAIIVGGAYIASAVMTLFPAISASRIAVAEALRYE
jgi:putative ABC transport system permease protein